MGLVKRAATVAACMALGLGPATQVSAELSQADANRYLTARGDIDRLKAEATKAFQDAQAKFNAKDIPGACGDLQTSADKMSQMADAEDIIIRLSADSPGSASLHKNEKDSQLKSRDMVLATKAKICPGTPATDAAHARYDADMNDYEALNKAANGHLTLAQNATDTTVKCREYKADLTAMRDGLGKMDEMIAIIKNAKADPAEMETTRAGNQATLAQVQATYDSTCAGR